MTTSLAIAGLREQLVPLAASPYVLEGGGMSALGQKLCSIRKRQRISRGSGRSPQWIIRAIGLQQGLQNVTKKPLSHMKSI